MRWLWPAVLLVLLATACGSGAPPVTFAPSGPAGVVRVALANLHWPLDPAYASGRDELVVARAVFATPLRTDPASGDLQPGLCAHWGTPDQGRTWQFRCAHAAEVARAVERMRRLPAAPAGWLFEPIARVEHAGTSVTVRLRFPWARFPYALSVPAAAPIGIPGPFRVARSSSGTLVVHRPGLRVVFRRLAPLAAVRAFRSGQVDDAPVPVGDLQRLRLDRKLGPSVHVRRLIGVDVVTFQLGSGALAQLPHTRRVYWLTADRGDYAQLIAETPAAVAFSLVGSAPAPESSAIRQARRDIANLPPVAVPIAVPLDPDLRYAADLLVAGWRELGLGPSVARHSAVARFDRILAPYPREEAVPAALLRDVLAARAPTRVDNQLRAAAAVVPIARVVSARLVSPRLRGWRQDALGVVDYGSVRALASSRTR